MKSKEIVKAIRKKYGTIRRAAEVKNIPEAEIRKKIARLSVNKGINKVKNPIEIDVQWLKNEFDL